MDLTVLWIILGVIVGAGFLVGIWYLLKKLGVPMNKLFGGIDTAQFIMNFIKLSVLEMLKTNPDAADKAEFIMDLVLEAVEFIEEQLKGDLEIDKEELILDAIDFAEGLAESFDVVLTSGEKIILHDSIRMVYNAWEALNI